MATLPKVGEGEEYDLRRATFVVTDPEVISWRLNVLLGLGFDMENAEWFASVANIDVHTIEKWLKAGATHQQVIDWYPPL